MGAKILLIDYDPCSICRIRGALSTLGLQAIVALDGIAGVESFERYRPDLTLIHDLIPRKHGFEVCKELKATEHGQRSPILLLADVRNGRRYAVLSTGCDDFVPKPIDGRILIEKVRKLLPGHVPPACDERAPKRGRRRPKRLTDVASPR